MDRSTRNLSIITFVVLAIFLALNHVSRRSGLMDWGAVLLFLLLALGVWFYDRVNRRSVDDSEASDTVIEPLVYDHANAPIGIPDTIELVAPNPGTVIHTTHPAPPVIESAPPVRADVDNANRAPQSATTARAEATMAATPPPDATAEDKTETPPPAPAVEHHPPATAATTTTIEEKAAPIPSSPAQETHPDLAAKTPGGANVPSTPVSSETASEPVPTSVAGSAPEPKSRKAARSEPAVVPPKTATELGNALAEHPELQVSPSQPVPEPKNAVAEQVDDLKVVEGIGPKMEKALHAAGITTFAMLAEATEAQLKEAIANAGMRFAPSVPTWAEQASFAANGDFAGLEAFQKTLLGGRKAK